MANTEPVLSNWGLQTFNQARKHIEEAEQLLADLTEHLEETLEDLDVQHPAFGTLRTLINDIEALKDNLAAQRINSICRRLMYFRGEGPEEATT